MLGTPAQHGMIPRAMAQLFATSAELEASGWSFDMKVATAEGVPMACHSTVAAASALALSSCLHGGGGGPGLLSSRCQQCVTADRLP
jgi:hypothetical protein